MPHLRTSMPIPKARKSETRVVQERLDKLAIQVGKAATNEQIRNIFDNVHKQNASVKALTATNEILKERHNELVKDIRKLTEDFRRENTDIRNGLERVNNKLTSDKSGIWKELNRLDERKADSGRVQGAFDQIVTNMESRQRQRSGYRYYYWDPNDNYEACLSRRKMDGNGNMSFLPDLHSKPTFSGSVRTSRSEPYYMDYGRNRLIYEKNYGREKNFFRGRNLKEFGTDRVITILDRPEKRANTNPRRECRCVVSESRFRDLNDFIDELAIVLNMSERERYIHSDKYHTMVRTLADLEDGGEYYVGSASFNQSSAETSTPDSVENDIDGDESKKSDRASRFSTNGAPKAQLFGRGDRKKKVMIMTNYAHGGGSTGSFSFVVDEMKHRSMPELCQDISASVNFTRHGYAVIERLCLRNGRTVTSISEILHSPDDTIIAIIGSSDPYAMYDDPYGRGAMGYRGMPPPVNGLNGRPTRRLSTLNRYGEKPFEISIGDKVHVFDPPAIDYLEPQLRKIEGPPAETMEIDWIYGYNGKHCRNNLVLLPSLELVYFVAKVVVLFDPDEDKQRFYTEHTDEIRCIAQHPSSWIMATGQVACTDVKGISHIRIWDAKSLATLNVLRYKGADMSVECLSFSQDDNGMKLVAIANSTEEWKLQVWDWEESVLLSESKPYHEIELACSFDPLNSDIVISCGKSHVYFWDTSNIEAEKTVGQFYDYDVPDFVTCLGFDENSELITADSNGYLHKWLSDEKKTYNIIKTNHTSSIITMDILTDDYVITGGGSDRMLCLINCEEPEPTVAEVEIPEEYGGIIAISPIKNDFNEDDLRTMKFILGTSNNSIVCGSLDTEFTSIVNGSSNELTALKSHPIDQSFIVCGMDLNVRYFSGKTHKAEWEGSFDVECTAVDFNPNGKAVAIGCEDGKWMVLRCDDGSVLGTYTTESSKVTCMSYSIDGQFIAVGMESGAIYWYQCGDNSRTYRYMSSAKVFCDPIISLDWSVGASHVRFVTSSFEYEIWNVKRNSIETNQIIVKDIQFEKDTSAMHYYTAGIWNNPEKDLTFPVVDKSHNKMLLCAGTSNGGLRLYNYPVEPHPNMIQYVEGDVHSTTIAGIAFLNGDKTIISCGKNDYAIAQWKVSRSKEPVRAEIRDSLRDSLRYDNAYPYNHPYGHHDPWRPYSDYGHDYTDPLAPRPPPGYPTGGAPFRGGRRQSIFQKEYVAKHPNDNS